MALPGWLDALYDAGEMRRADAGAAERGVAGLDLMERAGAALADSVAGAAPGGPVRIVVGRGNNGGDGLVAARLLRAAGRDVDVLTVAPLPAFSGDARTNLERLPGPPPAPFGRAALDGAAVVVDAIFGTGFSGAPRAPADAAIAGINRAGAPVVSCDVPSGVDASTGEIVGEAVRATVTVTFHALKIGLCVAPGAFAAGEVRVVDIGIPPGEPPPGTAGLITERVLDLVPPRPRDGSKFTSGVVVVAGGSRGLTGAPTMAALGAMRAGAGYVQVAVPASAVPAMELRLLEAMARGLPEHDGAHTADGAGAVAELAGRAGAVVLGPGLGRSDGAVAFARAVAASVDVPLLLDADGLNAHAGPDALAALGARGAPTVLTPHAGELATLLQSTSDEVGRRRLASARAVARQSGAVVVLKGDDSLVVGPDGPVAVSPGGTPALATAGTGDVLSGLVGALLAKGLDPFAAAAAGVFAHARARTDRRGARRRGLHHRERRDRRPARRAVATQPRDATALIGALVTTS